MSTHAIALRIVCGTVVFGVLSGCGASAHTVKPAAVTHATATKPAAPASKSPAPAKKKVAALPALSAKATIERVGLTSKDLPSGFTVKLAPKGDQVRGKATMQMCGYRFSTEAHRVARREVSFLSPSGQEIGAGGEVAVYDTAASAAKAMTEWRTAMTSCPRGKSVTELGEGYTLKYSRVATRTDASLPVPNNTVSTIIASIKGSATVLHVSATLQQRGRTVTVVFINLPMVPKASDLSVIRTLAITTGTRLPTS